MDEDAPLLSSDLKRQLDGGVSVSQDDLVLLPKKKQKGPKKKKKRFSEDNLPVSRPDRAEPSLKKSQRGAEAYFEKQKQSQRKRKYLEKQEKIREKAKLRKKLLASLAENQLSAEEQSLLKSSSKLGSKDTLREQLRNDLLRERKGLDIEDGTKEDVATQAKASKKRKRRAPKSGFRMLTVEQEESSSSDEDDSDAEVIQEVNSAPVKESAPQPEPTPATKPTSPKEALEKVPASDEGENKNKEKIPTEPAPKAENFVVRVKRSENVEKSRRELPVCMMEQEIMETIEANACTVLCGETGSGKTTQVPQFLFEAGYGCKNSPDPVRRGIVGVTQPRRVATVSMARRVGYELGVYDSEALRDTIGYQIRYDARTIKKENRIKFMTDGVLLREAREDLLLRKYSVIILDEAHERNLNGDILLGILSRIVPLRQQLFEEGKMKDVFPLKVIVMSATLRVDDFANNPRLFVGTPTPVLKVESRQFPVTVHFSRRTELRNYLQATFNKVCAVHRRLPAGGILVFLTGQREIEWMCKALKSKYGNNKVVVSKQQDGASNEQDEIEYSDIDESDQEADEEGEEKGEDNEDSGKGMTTSARIKQATGKINPEAEPLYGPVHVLPLYSRLPTHQQMEVFKQVPENHRLIVVSTNVAETSITIPGIKYVVDCGREKRKVHNQVQGTSAFEIGWISQASANQRSGRAGRTGPGHCYRLYSSAVFNDQFEEFPQPELVRMPIEDVILYMKTMGIDKVSEFPFPSLPDVDAIGAAESRLVQLGALERESLHITNLGRRIAQFPVQARLAKMLSIASCDTKQAIERLAHVVGIVSGLSLQSPFMHMQVIEHKEVEPQGEIEEDEKKSRKEEERQRHKLVELAKNARANWESPSSDAISLLMAAGAYAHNLHFNNTQSSNRRSQEFCKDVFLHFKTMREQLQLRQQLSKLVAHMRVEAAKSQRDQYNPDSDNEDEQEDDDVENASGETGTIAERLRGPLKPLSRDDEVYLCQVMTSGYLDQVARKMTLEEARAVSDEFNFNLKHKWPYTTCNPTIESPLYIHSHSNLWSRKSTQLPEFVIYGHIEAKITETQTTHYMKQVTAVSPAWLFELSKGTPQCSLGPILEHPPPTYNAAKDSLVACVHPLFSPRRWKLPSQWVAFPDETEDHWRARARWFGRAVLEGKVISGFGMVSKWFAIPPPYMTQKIHDPRVQGLMQALLVGPTRGRKKKRRKPVFSKASLLEAWKKDPSYLQPELLRWVQKAYINEFKTVTWPEIVQSKK